MMSERYHKNGRATPIQWNKHPELQVLKELAGCVMRAEGLTQKSLFYRVAQFYPAATKHVLDHEGDFEALCNFVGKEYSELTPNKLHGRADMMERKGRKAEFTPYHEAVVEWYAKHTGQRVEYGKEEAQAVAS